METLLIIDDEETLCRTLEKVLFQEGRRIVWTVTAAGVPELIRETSPSCVLLDLKLANFDGLTVLAQIKEQDPRLPVIILTAFDTVKTAVQAMKQGAFHYLAKPFDNEELKLLIDKAMEQRRLHQQIEALKGRLGEMENIEEFMGSSEKIREVIKLVRSVAASDISVLLLGESGTGKELVARTIHNISKRSKGSMITVDCAAIPETLIESELFGHEKGAYTGATSMEKGKFELADGGTILLDEVGNIPGAAQSKLLRFLETHEFERIGGKKPIKTNVRVIAATNADLGKSSRDNLFRLDLLYRLNEFPIHLPPLRERKEDIPLLCRRFLLQMGPEAGKEVHEIDSLAMERLKDYDYPGNVRELRNIIRRAVVVATTGCIELADLPREVRNPEQKSFTPEIRVPISGELTLFEASRQAVVQIERQLILEAILKAGGHHGKAAILLGVATKTLYNKMKEYGIHH